MVSPDKAAKPVTRPAAVNNLAKQITARMTTAFSLARAWRNWADPTIEDVSVLDVVGEVQSTSIVRPTLNGGAKFTVHVMDGDELKVRKIFEIVVRQIQ